MAIRPGSVLAPLAQRQFRLLWAAFSAFNVGVWMQSLGAQWFLVSHPGGAEHVALVQSAMTLPIAVLALPAGILADNLDRRRLLIAVQAAALIVTLVLALLTRLDLLSVWGILMLTALIGVSNVLTIMPFQSLVADLVPRRDIPSASALVAVGANLARIAGPAIAGVVVAELGVSIVFALGASVCALFLCVLVPWDGGGERVSQRERFFPAARSGIRYVRHSPQLLRLVLRAFWFTSGMMSLFALLPLLSTDLLGLGPGGLGALIACIGVGAVAGGLSAGGWSRRLGTNTTVALAFATCAVVVLALPLVPALGMAVPLLVLGGWGWTLSLSTMAGSMQLYLPAWVRARGLATYWMAMFGGQAVGSVVLGAVAGRYGLTTAFAGSGAFLAVGATLAVWIPVSQFDELDRSPSTHWPEPQLVVDPDEIHGEVVIQTIYWIDREVEADFLAGMVHVRRVRLRTGGSDWRLLKDAETPRRFVEEYTVSSWQEHEYQLHQRLVTSDRLLETRAAVLSTPSPVMLRLYRFDARS